MALPRIVWGPRAPEAELHRLGRETDFMDLAGTADQMRTRRLSLAILDAGIPSVADATTPKEDAIGLLMLAAEVEHALMSQYLYAAQSLRGPPAKSVSHVAIQEMGHLLTVQNLMLALAGIGAEGLPSKIHLGRDGMRVASGRNPLPLILEPISLDALAKFVIVERPHHIPDAAIAAKLAQLEQLAAALGISVNPVYALYAAIRWLFQPDDSPDGVGLSSSLGFRAGWHVADGDFADPGVIEQYSADPIEWGSVPALIIAPVSNRAGALAALDLIAAQGEGMPDAADSHFAVFLALVQSFESGAVGVKPMPRTPRTPGQKPSEDPEPTELTDAYTVLWADLFNHCYELLLVDIAWAISHPKGQTRTDMIRLCLRSMGDVIQPIAKDLTGRPVGPDSDHKAGPPYALGNELMPDSVAGFRERFAHCLAGQRELMAAIRASAAFSTDAFAAVRLAAIARINTDREMYLPGEP